MALAEMSEADRRIIFECLRAAAHGPFFRDADLSILFGLERRELIEIAAGVPELDDSEPNVRGAIGAALIDLISYPHGRGAEWGDWISVSRSEVDRVGDRWRSLLPPIVYESFEVFGPACFGGRYYRVVGYRMRGGAQGRHCEVWSSGRWLDASNGPGGPAIMAALPASREEMLSAGVDCSPLPGNYDPFSAEGDSSAAE